MNKLKQFAYNRFSQFGEDGIIEKIFEILPTCETYWCVEFGAWDGKFLSNTYNLITNKNWKGILIEGNKRKFPDLVANYKSNTNAILINKLVSFAGSNSLDSIFSLTNIPYDFDLLSIDIDGNDYHIWESLENYRPKVVIIEFNPSIPNDIEFIQEKNFDLNHGSSLLSIIKLAKLKGYELIATTFCNGFFVQKEYFNLFNIEDNSISVMWDTETRAPRVFQLYDGSLVLSEGFKLIWHDRYISKFDLQVFPKFLRFFSDSTHMSIIYRKFLRKLHHQIFLTQIK